MKILCVADHVDPLIYSTNINKRFHDVEIVLGAGDLRLKYYDYIVSNLNKKCFFVFGNHRLEGLDFYKKNHNLNPFKDDENREEEYLGAGIHIDTKVVLEKGVIIAGLGGSRWYNGAENQYTEFGMALKILTMIPSLVWHRIVHKRFLDILLTHAPPFEINDRNDPCHTGFKVFRWFLRVFKPRYLLHGHIHLYNQNDIRRTKYYDTMVVNAYNHILIDIQVKG
jgi:uncharacterized protein